MNSSPNIAIGRVIIFILIASILMVIAFKFWPKTSVADLNSISKARDNIGINTTIPKEIQVKYLPASFRFEIDEEDAVAIITNPLRYKRDFNDLVRNINLAILDHVSNRMSLDEETKLQIRKEYEKSHAYLRNLYYEDFLSLRDSSSILAQQWYSKESSSAIEVLHEVASKYTCFLVNQIMATVLETSGGSYYGKGKKVETPCGIAIQEALNPMFKRLEQSAAIQDFSRSKKMLEERIEREVIELATYEIQSKKGLSKQLKTKLFGLKVSTTNLEISAISVLKIGFNLQKYFSVDLNPDAQVVTITLPQPQILSHAVYPNADKLDIGWMREVSESDLNRAFEALRAEFVREARREEGFEKAKAHAQQVMEIVMGPSISAINPNYKVRVIFQSDNNLGPDLVIKDEFSDLND